MIKDKLEWILNERAIKLVGFFLLFSLIEFLLLSHAIDVASVYKKCLVIE